MISLDLLKALITKHEGFELRPYTDSVGKLTIGVGRNLTDKGLSPSEVDQLLTDDIYECEDALRSRWPVWLRLDDVRQAVLVDMTFNLGIGGLLQFHNTLASIASGDWNTAADEMMASKWATQVGDRAAELATMMRTGAWPPGVTV